MDRGLAPFTMLRVMAPGGTGGDGTRRTVRRNNERQHAKIRFYRIRRRDKKLPSALLMKEPAKRTYMVLKGVPCVHVQYAKRRLHPAEELEAFLTDPEIAKFGIFMEQLGRAYDPNLDEPL